MRKKLFLIVSFFIVLFSSIMLPGTLKIHADSYNGGILGGTGSSWDERTYPWESDKNTHLSHTPNRSNLAEEGDKFYYRLEAGMPDDEKASWYNPLGKTADVASVAFGESVMFINKIMFGYTKDMTTTIIGFHEMTGNFKFIEKGIDEISEHVTNMVGINEGGGLSFSNSGMFYKLISLIVIAVIVYSFYQLVWKRSFVSSFTELLKFILVLTLSLLLFSNYGVFLKTMNKTSNQINDIVVGSVSSLTEGESSFERTLWEKMIDKPYLILQYGTDDLDKLTINEEGNYMSGKQRVRNLLISSPASESRHEIISKEINEYKNYHMTFDSVVEKSINNVLFLSLNLILLIPLIIINVAILFTQIWFIIMSLLAPFALLIASFPTQFNVLGRYAFELLLPLIIKIFLGFFLVMIIFLTDLISQLEMERFSNLLNGQFGESFVTFVLFFILMLGIFFLRTRIMNIINSGSEKMAEVREGLGSITTKPVGTTVRGGTNLGGAVVGTAVGTAVGNPLMGTMTGMKAGTIAGDAVTGKSESFSNVAKDTAGLAYQATMYKHIAGVGNKKANTNSANENQQFTPSFEGGQRERSDQNQITTIDEIETNEPLQQHYASNDILPERQEQFNQALAKQNIDMNKISSKTLARHDVSGGDLSSIANDIKANQIQEQELVSNIKDKRVERFDNYLKEQNLNEEEISGIKQHLETKKIDVASIPKKEYESVNNKLRERMEDNDKLFDYRQEFQKELVISQNEQRLTEQRARVLEAERKTPKVPRGQLK